MDRLSEEIPGPAAPSHLPATSRETRQPDLDLDRLVWDPEYREATRSRLRAVR
ncbi:MAG: hypothetical protein ACM35H_12175 [Bacteroidota bacterium]|nr:hypothetical protein [Kiloniellaceae bacterium]